MVADSPLSLALELSTAGAFVSSVVSDGEVLLKVCCVVSFVVFFTALMSFVYA